MVDTRMWNLVVGLGLIGCGTPAMDESQSTSGTESTSGDGDGDWSDEWDGGCDYSTGCSSYEDCIDGECVPWECIYGFECNLFEECLGFECTSVGAPPPDCEFDLLDIPTEMTVGAPSLALSFVDLDDDGRDHLVVATETELLIYEFGAGAPTSVPRDPSSLVVQSMAAGQFDAQPGEDLVLLVDGIIHRYFSDGAATLVNPNIELSPSLNSRGLSAGDFDGQPPTDLLIWGWDAAAVDFGAMRVSLTDHGTEGAAFFPLGSSNPGLVINTESDLSGGDIATFDLMGNPVDQHTGLFIDGSPVAVETPDAAAYLGAWPYEIADGYWSRLKRLHPDTGGLVDTIFIPDAPMLAAADLDGDLYPEVVAGGGLTTIVFDPLGEPCLVDVDLGIDTYLIRALAVGDHDGDGDEEVALRLSSDAQPDGAFDDPGDGPSDRVFIIDGG